MPCYKPLNGYRSRAVNPSGKRGIVFNVKEGFSDLPVEVPCGQCIGCRLERSRQWAIRCVHEASLYDDNCFITLTYAPEHLPDDRSLHKEHFQKFMKRFRKKFPRTKENNIRYFHCGEYGEKYGRPHYHAIIFNHDFDDKKFYSKQGDHKTFTSETLSTLWPYGLAVVGGVSFQSAAYVARYITKKVTGEKAEQHYTRLVESTGEIVKLQPEYTTMSRRPGIGSKWLEQYGTDVYPSDFIVLNGKKMTVPKAYDRKFELEHPEDWKKIKAKRQARLKENAEHLTRERLEVREKVKLKQTENLKRHMEAI